MKIQPVILSGGSGTRLWPLSREFYPKQLLSLNSELSLLQETVKRLDGLDKMVAQNTSSASGHKPDDSIDISVLPALIVCNEEHRFLVAEQARQAEIALKNIVLEPSGRNTAPALTLAAEILLQDGASSNSSDPAAENNRSEEAVMLVMPADHVIKDIRAFHQAIQLGAQLALKTYLVTFGIVPGHAETGYGYIKKGGVIDMHKAGLQANDIASFVEKPDAATAQSYLDSGEYLWNSGMFMMKASIWLQAINQYSPEMCAACQQAVQQGEQDQDFFRVHSETFNDCSSDSIDYAVMEKISTAQASAGEIATTEKNKAVLKSAVIPLDAGWSDIGSWSSLWESSVANEQGNVIKGDVYSVDTRNSLLLAEHRLLATVGLDDIVVIETADAVLVARKDKAQHVKQIVEKIKADKRTEHQIHRRVHRPWGCYESVDVGDRFQVKRITVKPGCSLSLQMHHHRAEHWIVVKGAAKVTKGEETFLLSENESTYIPIGVTHRLENPGTLPLELIEVQSGSYLGEDDIVRFEDDYNRS